ncbi:MULTISPECIES: CoA-binding protein [unclassified Fusibacter]|uniref:CoA-binding protein n=1 Tax=unclassified Fusibacter TaxID=2624464 RepID=UPI00101086B7|nr:MULTISPECIES: CoA-binding protein [unclassified Fusibacter]MCK8061271.1 CoA-binding protein [Fusibacter sp. A2]NPE23531.1 CoA-binding protein [Fusibacter sp. A1]RXV59135.1 CoA-binding protein [Fusibacter sp. A1]
MKAIVNEMLQLKSWAVVGATRTTAKFGYKIFDRLNRCGYQVVPVNPMYDEVNGIACKPSIKETTGIEVVNVVVGPDKAYDLLDDLVDQGIKYVWFQPGAYNDKVIQKASSLDLKVVYGYCVLVELGELPFCPI